MFSVPWRAPWAPGQPLMKGNCGVDSYKENGAGDRYRGRFNRKTQAQMRANERDTEIQRYRDTESDRERERDTETKRGGKREKGKITVTCFLFLIQIQDTHKIKFRSK